MPRHLLSRPAHTGAADPAPRLTGTGRGTEGTRWQRPAGSSQCKHTQSQYVRKFEKQISTGIPNLFFYALINSILFF